MDILDDMGVSKLSAIFFFFLKVNYSFNTAKKFLGPFNFCKNMLVLAGHFFSSWRGKSQQIINILCESTRASDWTCKHPHNNFTEQQNNILFTVKLRLAKPLAKPH